MALPPLAANGYLPVGRHTATLTDLHAQFVAAPGLAGSVARPILWDNLRTYLARWDEFESRMAQHLSGE